MDVTMNAAIAIALAGMMRMRRGNYEETRRARCAFDLLGRRDEVGVHENAPVVEQPLGDAAAVPVLLTATAEVG